MDRQSRSCQQCQGKRKLADDQQPAQPVAAETCSRTAAIPDGFAWIEALSDPAVRKQLENLGLQMTPLDRLSPQALADWQKAEIAKWWPMIKAANVKID